MATTSAAAKTQKKSLPSHLTPGNPGNSGGKKGRSGRRPGPFKDFLARLRQDPAFQDALEAAAKDATSRGFGPALKVLTDYDEEKPAQRIVVDVARIKAMTDDELRALVEGRKGR